MENIASKVIRGDFGNGAERIAKLTDEGYNPRVIQALVNRRKGK